VNYYNEHDPKAAAWLRELIRAGEIPAGLVDERSITEIKPNELTEYAQCHFFAGIGGWSLALKLAGWPTSRKVWTGSCPCQPFSSAGRGLGEADERHLWPVFRNLIGECHPPVVFGEQVASQAGLQWLDGVCADMEAAGYAIGAADLCAAGVGSPHIRQRLYWVAYSDLSKCDQWTRSGKQSLCVGNEKTGGMEHAKSNGRQQRQAEPSRRSTASGRSNGGLADTESKRWNGSAGMRRTNGRAITETGGGLGNADICENITAESGQQVFSAGCNPADRNGSTAQGTRKVDTAWDDAELIACSDGKARRIKSGSFPLAHGISGRVGLLRGYGNAIVPQVACEFISAWLDTSNAPHQPCGASDRNANNPKTLRF
jgi:DNA (cytosine-5)-methyltransferase 1